MKKQKIIAKWLKGLCILLGLMLLAFFAALTWIKLFSDMWFTEDTHHILILFSSIICVCCYSILFQFWKVCKEIEVDNSFSMENARSFHIMAVLGCVIGLNYLIRLIFVLIVGFTSPAPMIFAVIMIFVSIAFVIVCECLSQLIKNAYEVKLENELTI